MLLCEEAGTYKDCTVQGSVVLDPCAGSGRFLAAAEHVGAALVLGMDINPFQEDWSRSPLRCPALSLSKCQTFVNEDFRYQHLSSDQV